MAQTEEMTFKQLYEQAKAQPTPAQQFIKEVAELTCSTETTVRLWLGGSANPDALAKKVMAEHFNAPVETLFPTTSK